MDLTYASVTHPGNVRKVNEDSVLQSSQNLWAIADGMGGYAAGDVASRLVIDSLAKVGGVKLETVELESVDLIEYIEEVLQQVNQKLVFEMTVGIGNEIMGSTVVVAACHNHQCTCLWAGDSRLYVQRQGELYQISKDHSVVQELIDDGVLSAEQADNHPQSHVITRAVGVHEELDLSKVTFDLQPDDVLMLCSDGLYNEVDAETIRNLLSDESLDCELKAQALLGAALDTDARDNISVSVIQVPA
jgi:serine/threonine protein phosphatase PrpC